jgi:hypothetical protein
MTSTYLARPEKSQPRMFPRRLLRLSETNRSEKENRDEPSEFSPHGVCASTAMGMPQKSSCENQNLGK